MELMNLSHRNLQCYVEEGVTCFKAGTWRYAVSYHTDSYLASNPAISDDCLKVDIDHQVQVLGALWMIVD